MAMWLNLPADATQTAELVSNRWEHLASAAEALRDIRDEDAKHYTGVES
jgi:hypothetical protein